MEFTKEEKHTPVIKISGNKVKISVPNHPLQSEEHYISNITLFRKNGAEKELVGSRNLTFKDEAIFELEVENTENLYATEVCNLHGEWDSEEKFLGM